MNIKYNKSKINKGFSLLELSISLVIIGLIIIAPLAIGSNQIDGANIKSTQAKLDRIDQALAIYLKANNALPCPADGAAALNSIGVAGALTNPSNSLTITGVSSTSYPYHRVVTTSTAHGLAVNDRIYISNINDTGGINNQYFIVSAIDSATKFEIPTIGSAYVSGGAVIFGISDASCAAHAVSPPGYNLPSGSPNYYVGIVPVRTLGLSDDYAIDAWGNRITYAVSKACIDPDNWNDSNTYKCTDIPGTAAIDGGNITINYNTGTTTGTAKVTNAAYVILSLGKNGYGAWSRAGTKSAKTTNNNEANNSSDTYATAVFNDGLINDGSHGNNYFDDIIHFKTAAKTWSDAYMESIAAACLNGQALMSNGGNSYSCSINGLTGHSTDFYPSSAYAMVTLPSTILASDYNGGAGTPPAKFMIITNFCDGPTGGAQTASTSIKIDITASNSITFTGCSTYNNTLARVETYNAMMIPMPESSLDVKLSAASAAATPGTRIDAFFLY